MMSYAKAAARATMSAARRLQQPAAGDDAWTPGDTGAFEDTHFPLISDVPSTPAATNTSSRACRQGVAVRARPRCTVLKPRRQGAA